MTSGWQVEHTCPQCGAPVVLDETDHLMPCAYCRVCCYLVSKEAHRYYIPPSKEILKRHENDIFFFPYWRFKGVQYTCLPFEIRNQHLDATVLAMEAEGLPYSLGLRPQVLRLKFLQPEAPGLFGEPAFDLEQAVTKIMHRLKLMVRGGQTQASFYSGFLSEAHSLIYAPFVVAGGSLVDGVTGRVLASRPGRERPESVPAKAVPWEVKFIPAVCPHCGWDLTGDRSTLVMICRNCGQASAATPLGLKKIRYSLMEGGPDDLYLPFWRIKADTRGIELKSFGDFIRVANLPRVVTPGSLEQAFHFWAPAFKGAPRLYLRACRNVTVAQPEVNETGNSRVGNLAPVNHSFRDAADGLKLALAHMAVGKRKLFPQLASVTVEAVDHTLVYLPFHPLGREMVNEQVQLSINRTTIGLE